MGRSKGNSDFGEVILWGIGAYIFYRIFGKNTSIVGQEKQVVIPENEKWKFNKLKKIGSFFGNPIASNLLGSGTFNYQNTLQNRFFESELRIARVQKRAPIYIIPDTIKKNIQDKLVGLECKFISVINLYKSLGIIHPEMTAKTFAEMYTNIFDTDDLLYPIYKRCATYPYYSIDPKYNADIRGFLPEDAKKVGLEYHKFTEQDYVKLANQLALHSDYAKRTGMDKKTFTLINFSYNSQKPDFTLMNSFLAKGRLLGANIVYDQDGHYVNIIKLIPSKGVFFADDPLSLETKIYPMKDIINVWSIDLQ